MNISDIIITLLPFLSALSLFLFRLAEQRLPEKQRNTLDKYAKYAVQTVEQKFGNWTPIQKKARAIALIEETFRAAHLPIPDVALIDTAIESFVYEVNSFQDPTPPPDNQPIAILPSIPPTQA